MKKIFVFVSVLFVLNGAFASVSPTGTVLKASEIFLPVGSAGEKISLLELSSIKIKKVEELTGNKMSFVDRLAFKVAQKKLSDNIMPDGSFGKKAIQKAIQKQQKNEGSSFHFGGFAMGFFLGPIGILIAYLINDDNKRSRVKSAWRGFLAAMLIAFAILKATGV
jgi:hypothetical protein